MVKTDQDLVVALLALEAMSKLTRTLRSKIIINLMVRVGDLIEIYSKGKKDKRGRCLKLRSYLSLDCSSGTVTVPARNGCTTDAALEGGCAVLSKDSFAMVPQNSIKTIDRETASAPDEYTATLDLDTASSTERTVLPNDGFDDNVSLVSPSAGNQVKIFWSTDNQFHSGEVTAGRNGKYRAI